MTMIADPYTHTTYDQPFQPPIHDADTIYNEKKEMCGLEKRMRGLFDDRNTASVTKMSINEIEQKNIITR